MACFGATITSAKKDRSRRTSMGSRLWTTLRRLMTHPGRAGVLLRRMDAARVGSFGGGAKIGSNTSSKDPLIIKRFTVWQAY
jgi:hypothetical protein